jgi:hypothetical protein
VDQSDANEPAPPVALEEGAGMEVHKPKRWRGVRGFLKEYVIIAAGVLTALGAEQAVEALHEHGLAREAQADIRAEMQEDITRVASRLDQQRCLDKRLNEIAALLADWSSGKALPAGLSVGNPSDIPLVVERWQANLNSGRFSRQVGEAQAQEADFYTRVGKLNEILTHEHYAWSELRTLELGPVVLGPDTRPQLIAALQSARTDSRDASELGQSVLDAGKRAGLAPRPYTGFTITTDTCGALVPA